MTRLPPVLVSADCHVTEPLDLWTRNLPPGMRDRGPRIERRDGRSAERDCGPVSGATVAHA